MFKTEIEALYRFQSKEELVRKFSVIKQDRKSVVLYDFDKIKWVAMPDDHQEIRIEDLDLYKKLDPTKIMFIRNKPFTDIIHEDKCRRLTEDDGYKFAEFHKACPDHDQNQGMVSLADPVVYGCYVDGRLVSVASLWNWGEHLSDIGVLTHPDYRGKGYAMSVIKVLLNAHKKMFIWRCEVKNSTSCRLAKRIGFIEAGMIYSLRK